MVDDSGMAEGDGGGTAEEAPGRALPDDPVLRDLFDVEAIGATAFAFGGFLLYAGL